MMVGGWGGAIVRPGVATGGRWPGAFGRVTWAGIGASIGVGGDDDDDDDDDAICGRAVL